MNVKQTVVVHLVRMIVVYNTDVAYFPCRSKKPVKVFATVNDYPHFEILAVGAVFLRTHIGNIEPRFFYKFKHLCNAARNIAKSEFKQNNGSSAFSALQISDFFKHFGRFFKLLRSTLRIYKKSVRIDRLVITHSCYVYSPFRETAACFQKCADVVRHNRYKCFFHLFLSLYHSPNILDLNSIAQPYSIVKRRQATLFG